MRLAPFCLAWLILMALVTGAPAKERSEVPQKLTWDLSELYPSDQAWAQARAKLAAQIPELASSQGHLGDSAEALNRGLVTLLDLHRQLDRLSAYAHFLYDQDTRVSQHLEMQQAAQQLGVQLDAASAWFNPELLAVGPEKVKQFLASDPRLQPYQPIFDDIFRSRAHTLSPAEEKIVARAGDLKDAGEALHTIFTNADMPYPEVTLSSGEKVRLDAQAYTRYRAVTNREDRDRVFKAFWTCYQGFRRTLGTSLYSQVKGHMFERDVHKYSSCLEAALFPQNIPTTVYTQLLADVHANLPTLHRYLKLRQKLMGVDQLRYEDLYAPLVKGAELHYTPEEAMELTLQATAPLGPDYTKALKLAFEHRWVDFMPNTGKRSGAYSEGAAYDVHPYQMLNFNGGYEDVSTLAHESGHSMHSYLSNTNQPFGLHNYSIFVAEVASTCNENLLLHYVLDHTSDNRAKLFLLGSYLETMRGTLFRQTLLAEFELKIHEMAEHGESLTGDNLNALYLKLLKEYYGHDQGVCKVDDLYAVEWAYIPHFYYNFYVYQYATSVVASTSIAQAIRDQGEANHQARDAYLKMLSSGSSRYPIDELKGAGVDMTTSAPFKAAMAEMNRVMDQIEAIQAKL